MPTSHPPLRPVPPNPNLEFDRKQARALLKSARRGDPAALRRFREFHPRFGPDLEATELACSVALHDAQLVVAREYGFASWPRWKQFVELRRLDRAARAEELVRAACSNDVRKAADLLHVEPELASFDLYTACVCGEVEEVERHLGTDPALAHRPGGPLEIEPILYACFSRLLRADADRRAGIVDVVRLLLERGADPEAHYWAEFDGEKWFQSALYGAAGIANDDELTSLLLDAGARIDPRDQEVIYHATEFADPECLRLLLERGSPPEDQVKYCLARATDFALPEHVALFLRVGADPNGRVDWDGVRTHLHKAVYVARSEEIVHMLVDAGGDVNAVDDRGVSVLRSAERNDDPRVVDLLRSRGARDDAVTDENVRQGGAITLCIAAGRNAVATIDRLVGHGARVDRPAGPDRTPPLHWAAWRGRLEALRRLVELGADIHWVNRYGGDALGTAIHGSANCFDANGGPSMRLPEEALPGDYPAIVEYLISRGSPLPERIRGGSEAVQDLLRRHGVPD